MLLVVFICFLGISHLPLRPSLKLVKVHVPEEVEMSGNALLECQFQGTGQRASRIMSQARPRCSTAFKTSSGEEVEMSGNALLECQFQLDPGQGVDTIKWYRNNTEIYRQVGTCLQVEGGVTCYGLDRVMVFPTRGMEINLPMSGLYKDNTHRLSISNIQQGGDFACQVTENKPPFHTETLGGYMNVLGHESNDDAENDEYSYYEYEEEETFPEFVPIFQTDPTTYTVDAGNTARLVCQVDQLGPYVISWKKVKKSGNLAWVAAGKSVMENLDKFSVKMNSVSSTLTILHVNSQDVGQYICEVSSQPPVTLKHTVEIKGLPSVHILGKPESGRLFFKSGEELALVCEGEGDPKPNIKWRRQNKKMPDGSMEMETDQIIYNSIDRRHVGTYICEGDNGFGALAQDRIHIQVLYQPIVYVEETYLYQNDSVVLELVCRVHAYPAAKVEWKRNDKPLQEGRNDKPLQEGRFKMEHRGTKHILAIHSPTKYDMGIYTCTASNSQGTAHAILEVQDTDNEQNLPEFTSVRAPTSKNTTGIPSDTVQSAASSLWHKVKSAVIGWMPNIF